MMKFAGVSCALMLWALPLSAAETTIQGDTMEVLERGESIRFIGNVVLVRSSDTIQAQRMDTTKSREVINASGNVRLTRKLANSGTLSAVGARAVYNTKTGDGTLWGNGRPARVTHNEVVSATATRTMTMVATKFDFSEAVSTGTAQGNVYGKTVDPETGDVYEFWSDVADFDHDGRRVHLTGKKQPRVRQGTSEGDRFIRGDRVIYDYETRSFKAIGQAQAIFLEDMKKEKS